MLVYHNRPPDKNQFNDNFEIGSFRIQYLFYHLFTASISLRQRPYGEGILLSYRRILLSRLRCSCYVQVTLPAFCLTLSFSLSLSLSHTHTHTRISLHRLQRNLVFNMPWNELVIPDDQMHNDEPHHSY